MERIERKLWELEGYALQKELAEIDENCAVITKAELKEYKRQAVKEFADELKAKVIDKTYINKDFNINISDIYKMIEETLKEHEE